MAKYKVTFQQRFFEDRKLKPIIIEANSEIEAINKVPNSFQTFKIKKMK